MSSTGSSRFMKDSYGTAANPESFNNQDYVQLKRDFLKRGKLFLDDMFPPDKISIGEVPLTPDQWIRLTWKRPKDIVKDLNLPKASFTVSGVSRFDYKQGSIGNCWFLASMGALTFQKSMFHRVVPQDQSFDEDYCGLFHFKFWRHGRWVDVVIDDKLPTVNNRLVFVESKDQTEFWPALLEKAYAKVCCSYGAMRLGTPDEALVDFTGGVHLFINPSEEPPDLWEQMCHANKSNSLMGCGTKPAEGGSQNQKLPNGLVTGHAYAVTGVTQLHQGTRLVRVFNPWGEVEWNGDWSDEANMTLRLDCNEVPQLFDCMNDPTCLTPAEPFPEQQFDTVCRSHLWQSIDPKEREHISVVDDGEFWMALEDFSRFFVSLDICSEGPDFLDGSPSGQWKTSVYDGRWVAGTTAGGCKKYTESFWTNPQYRVQVTEKFSGGSVAQGEKNMLVSLMQKPNNRNRHKVKRFYIGFYIYKVTKEHQGQKGRLPASYLLDDARCVALTQTFRESRDVMKVMSLEPGEYLIVPCTFDPNKSASFMLTIISKAQTHVQEDSGGHNHELIEGKESVPFKSKTHKERQMLIRQLSKKYDAVDPVQLQRILNEEVLKVKTGGFCIEACRSLVALLDTTFTGELSNEEFVCLWNKVNMFKDDFQRANVSKTGTLSQSELREALAASGGKVSTKILGLLGLRYSSPTGQVTLQNFITLALRLDCVKKIFQEMSEGTVLYLNKAKWLCLTMYI